MPMLLAGLEPDDVAGSDLVNGTAAALRPAEARSDDQGLTQRVGVPSGPGTWFEGEVCAANARGAGASNSGSTRTVPVRVAPFN
jgi:hypothetical protein